MYIHIFIYKVKFNNSKKLVNQERKKKTYKTKLVKDQAYEHLFTVNREQKIVMMKKGADGIVKV